MSSRSRTVVVEISILVASVVAAALALLLYPLAYGGVIYPGVSVRDISVGGLTIEEAEGLLAEQLPDPAAESVQLHCDGRVWTISWADAGGGYDVASTARAAYQVGRQGPWYGRLVLPWHVRLRGRSITPHTESARADLVREKLKAIAGQVHCPPTDATLEIASDGVTCVAGTAGRTLEIDANTRAVLRALDNGTTELELTTIALPPDRREPEPACTLARSLLSQPFILAADDPLTKYDTEFEVPPHRLADWLFVKPARDQMHLEVAESAIEAWLGETAPQLGPERVLDVKETLGLVSAALQAGEHRAQAAIRHPQSTYVVQAGDTLFDIAYSHGFPQWRLEEANPDVAPDELLIGMELTIPSIDVLFPEPLVPDKYIEIDLPEQQLRAYEDDEVVYDFTCSSGMTSTPTIAGQFQVLFKEREAYAQRWSLEMPYFMAVYYEGPDFANGIHELPIRSDGQRLWASVLGWPASYGCIILDVGDAEKLYHWAPVGTLVRIEGVAPGTPTTEQASSAP